MFYTIVKENFIIENIFSYLPDLKGWPSGGFVTFYSQSLYHRSGINQVPSSSLYCFHCHFGFERNSSCVITKRTTMIIISTCAAVILVSHRTSSCVTTRRIICVIISDAAAAILVFHTISSCVNTGRNTRVLHCTHVIIVDNC